MWWAHTGKHCTSIRNKEVVLTVIWGDFFNVKILKDDAEASKQ